MSNIALVGTLQICDNYSEYWWKLANIETKSPACPHTSGISSGVKCVLGVAVAWHIQSVLFSFQKQEKLAAIQQFGHSVSRHKPGHKVSNLTFVKLKRNKPCDWPVWAAWYCAARLEYAPVPFSEVNSIFSKQGRPSKWYGHIQMDWISSFIYICFVLYM